MHYLQVNIGRNVADTPMPIDQWLEFQFEVTEAIHDVLIDTQSGGRDSIEFHVGEGHWGGTGVPAEDSLHISTLVRTDSLPAPQFAILMTQFTNCLQTLAGRFGQDAIALITGSRLIKPERARA